MRTDWLYPPRPSYTYGSGVSGRGPGRHTQPAPPSSFPGFSDTEVSEALRRSRQGEALDSNRPRHHVVNRRRSKPSNVTFQSNTNFGFRKTRDDVVGMVARHPRRSSVGMVTVSRSGSRRTARRRASSVHDAYLHSLYRHDPYPPHVHGAVHVHRRSRG